MKKTAIDKIEEGEDSQKCTVSPVPFSPRVMDTSSHPARGLEEEEKGAAAELAALPPKLEDFVGGGVVNGESGGSSGAAATSPVSSLDQADPKLALPAAAAEASAPEQEAIYRGVTQHHKHGKWQARAAGNKGFFPGTFSSQEEATEPYDLAAIKFRGLNTVANSGHHKHGKWQARAADNKDLYLGTFGSQEEATEPYDIAAIKLRGLNAVTDSEISHDKDIIPSSTSQGEDDQLERPTHLYQDEVQSNSS